MRSALTGENEIKVFILYLMNQVNHGVCFDDIADMTYESGYVGYFDFADVFSKLIDSGDVAEESEKNVYAITARGKAIAENLAHLIPAASKTKGTAIAARHSDLKKSGAVYFHSVEEEGDGSYMFKCGLNDKSGEILRISLLVKDRATAEKISENFNGNPDAVYRGIYAILTKNADFLF